MGGYGNFTRGVSMAGLTAALATAAGAQTVAPPATATDTVSTNPVGDAAQAPTAPGQAGASADAGQLQEIVVTAQKRSQNLQRVPISVTAIGGADLQSRGIKSVIDLGGTVPGLTIEKYNGLVLPFLRGVGNGGSAAGNESSVAVYVDGVYYARLPASFFDLADVDRVEVLKGPQGTLFGRNSTGGIINIVTRDPSFDTKVSGSISYGRFNAVQGDLYVSTKLTDKMAIDFSVTGKTDSGFGNNLATGHRYGYEDSILGRSKLLFEPADGTKIVLSGFYSASLQPGERGAFPGTSSTSLSQPPLTYSNDDIGYYNSNSAFDPRDRFRIGGGSLRVEQDLSFAKLVSISAYSALRERTVLNGTSSPRPEFEVVLRGPVNLFTQEVQLVNKPGSSFDWILGLYYYNNHTAYSSAVFTAPLLFGPVGAQAPASQKSLSYAGFAQATYEIVPDLKLTGGIRYTADKTSAHGTFFVNTDPPIFIHNLPADTTHVNRVTFKAAADYQVTRNILAYASFSRGFKSGNYNIITYNSTSPTKPEGIDAYEAGLKTELFDRRVRLNGALFYYDIKNPQVEQIQPGEIIYSNAQSSRVKGGEFDAQALLARGLTARASFTYLDAKYRKYGTDDPVTGQCIQGCAQTSTPNPAGGALPAPAINASGNRTPFGAKVSFDFGGDYSTATPIGKVTATADLYHNSGYYFEPDNFLHQKGYYLLSAQLKLALTEHVAVRAFGKNLTGAHYAIGAQTQIGQGGYLWLPGSPRTYGVAADFSF